MVSKGLTESTGAQIYNVKVMGWYASDGINAGPYGKVSFSFIRVNDDGVKPFYTGSDFNNLVISQMRNGWAIMLAWTTEGYQHDIYVHDITIIHDDHSDCLAELGWEGCDYSVSGSKEITLGLTRSLSVKIETMDGSCFRVALEISFFQKNYTTDRLT